MRSEDEITLGVLSAIHGRCSTTQRDIAREVGIALGLVNSYLKRCATKGYVKISQAPANRYAYYLTPRGFAEKSRLTAEYLRQSFSLFRQARSNYRDLFALCQDRNWTRVTLFGLGDLCEVAVLCAQESHVVVVGIVGPAAGPRDLMGLPIRQEIAELGAVDAILLTDMRDAQAAYEQAVTAFPRERVLVPALLGVAPSEVGA